MHQPRPPGSKQPASFKPPQPIAHVPRQRHSYAYANNVNANTKNPQHQSVEMIKRELLDLYQKDKPSLGRTQHRHTMLPLPLHDRITNQLQSMQQMTTKPSNYNKDYLRLSKEYKLMESSCLKSSLPKHCPLCNEIIRQVFDRDGKERDRYWEWCDEVKPAISTKFLQEFFTESKNAIRTEILSRRHNIEDDLDSIADEEIPKPKPKSGSGIFSCWRQSSISAFNHINQSTRPPASSMMMLEYVVPIDEKTMDLHGPWTMGHRAKLPATAKRRTRLNNYSMSHGFLSLPQ
eukprot:scaffold43433_cov74-Cyclotella_meneghiniana.AAC.3